jgi:Fe-S-cluster containining protein
MNPRREPARVSSGLPAVQELADEIRTIGFTCTKCGACCRSGPGDSGLVLVSHDEVEALVAFGSGSWDEVVVPYPEFVPCGKGAAVTFGWCLRHEKERCRFLSDHECTAYPARPWICRTYPFALVEGDLAVSDCPGLGGSLSPEEAQALGSALLERARFEWQDEERMRRVFASVRVPEGKLCVIDGSGFSIRDR